MSDDSLRSQIEVATAYKDLLVPALFGQWAKIVLDAAQVQSGHRVLEVGCGTGVLARQAVGRAGLAGAVGGIDPAPGMLAVAGRQR